MLAVQREAEAELGDVTARSETPAIDESVPKKKPTLLAAMGEAGNKDLFAPGSEANKTSQLDSLLAKASQYSNFIRSTQGSSVDAFHVHAAEMLGKAGEADADEVSGGGKRKKSRKEKKHKKSKAEAEGDMQSGFNSAQSKMATSKEEQAAVQQWQPGELKGTLKDYQVTHSCPSLVPRTA